MLQTLCQMQRTSSSFLYVNSGPAHLQSIYSSAYICFNFRWNVSALLLEIIGHFGARYTANLEANIAHIIRFTLCGLWSRTYTMDFQLHIFRLQFSMERIYAAIQDNRTLQCPLYCKFGAKYSEHHPVYPMWTVVPDIYNVITARIFRLQYSAVGNCAAIVDINTIQCALYCYLGAKYSASPSSLHYVYCGP
jgi:hypothetical protein